MAIESVKDIPAVDFLEGLTLEKLESGMRSIYEKTKSELTGSDVALQDADDQAIILNACAVYMYWGFEHIQRSGKQNMLGTSWGDALEQLAALRGVERHDATAATITERFTLSAARPSVVSIPAGTRVMSSSGEIYFATSNYAEIPAGSLYTDVTCECTITGTAGNGYAAGVINQMVDLIGYVDHVSNVTASSGGADIESDTDLAERVFLASSGYSVAGPDDAYIYWIKSYNSEIGDVVVTSATPGEVDIYIVMQDGSVPGDEVVKGLQNFLQDDDIRPLTDKVVVSAPTTKSYDISVKYWINQSDSKKAVSIQSAVDSAISDYVAWQSKAIGRDINPDELIKRMITAGAKRVEITSPVFTKIDKTVLPALASKSVTYGGTEDD